MGQRLGSLIGALGGVVFVLVNAGALGSPISIVLRVAGVAAFVGAIWYAVIRTRDQPAGQRRSATALRVYWLCVIGEVIAIPVGAQILVRVFDQSQLTLVWVIFVVGVHFLPFARAFGVPLFTVLGVAMIIVAVVGAVIVLAVDPRGAAWAGVAAGFVLLAFSVAGAVSTRLNSRADSTPAPFHR